MKTPTELLESCKIHSTLRTEVSSLAEAQAKLREQVKLVGLGRPHYVSGKRKNGKWEMAASWRS